MAAIHQWTSFTNRLYNTVINKIRIIEARSFPNNAAVEPYQPVLVVLCLV